MKKAHESKDLTAIHTAMENINNAWQAASEEMYKATQENSKSSNDDSKSDGSSDDDVTDVELEEVKEDK